MRGIKILTATITVMLALLTLTACGKNEVCELSEAALSICGSWAYIHDTETAIAEFCEDGSAQYEGKNYTFECDDTYILLKNAKNETIKLRYKPDNEGMYLYSNKTYTFSGEGEPAGLAGEWTCAEENWSFTFTEEGTFMEDGYFPGYYSVDTESSTFTLIYNDQFEDTLCYFHLEGNQLSVEYPWRVVKTGTK